MKWKLSVVRNYSNGKAILDFGCGTGEFLKTCSLKGWNISGTEPSDKARSRAVLITQSQKIFKSIDSIDNNFDAITLWHVLEHVPDLNETIEKLKSRLKADGTMFIAVPNHQSFDALTYKEHWAGYDAPRHLWHFNQSSMKKLLNNHNLTLRATLPMKLDAYYVSLLSEKYKGQSNFIKPWFNALTTGMHSNAKAKKTGEYSSLIYIVKNES